MPDAARPRSKRKKCPSVGETLRRQNQQLKEVQSRLVEGNLRLLEYAETIQKHERRLAGANKRLREKNAIIRKQEERIAMASLDLLDKAELLATHEKRLETRNRQLKTCNRQIRNANRKAEGLLLNILPARVARDLEDKGTTVPQRFDSVTVLFSDIVNFTRTSSTMKPAELIQELNDLFTAFDSIMADHGCERIKTIGDAYLAVSGMHSAKSTHTRRMLQSSLEMIEFLKNRNCHSKHEWCIRVGIHSGPIVGGVVGIEKYIYDVFGDTINTASRMESNSKPMHINVSRDVYLLARRHFSFTPRKPRKVKGKGAMQMYFLQGQQPRGK